MSWLGYTACLLMGYALGSVPSGYLVARARGMDLRRVGSGNIGATNAFRVLGWGPGAVVLVADVLKGYLACTAGSSLWCSWLSRMSIGVSDPTAAQVLAGVGAVLGHTYTCWLGFRGGKGIATSAGVFMALAPLALAVALLGWLVVLLWFRYVSLASISAAVFLTAAMWLTQDHALLVWATTVVGVIAVVRHRENLNRLWKGTEPRLTWRRERKP
ncbi:MAG: glycerol-3-phosphate 1-O-acyltransferase PlsY [Verrucomicrobiota bacterium]|nr:glycerol-3-phosphate 1-O-acyltransferase PlsY [Limisphaera sp.]MDW8382016.1 glycerol-3-phosphate 1-O-acyltransferase PlsY [Verrucomicrobiota bacterium]